LASRTGLVDDDAYDDLKRDSAPDLARPRSARLLMDDPLLTCRVLGMCVVLCTEDGRCGREIIAPDLESELDADERGEEEKAEKDEEEKEDDDEEQEEEDETACGTGIQSEVIDS